MIKRDYYEVLEVERNADSATIKKAYRKKAYQFHPDHNSDNPEAEEKFKEASEAYEVLHDGEKRDLYDRYGHDGLKRSGFSGFHGFEDIFSSFGDIFEDFFTGSGRRSRSPNQPAKGPDLRFDLEIEFMEAARGMEKEIQIEKMVYCKRCGGTRSEPGSKPDVCGMCQGSGRVTRSQGFFSLATACPECRGEGMRITDPCKDCKGQGAVPEKKKLAVKTPAGVDTGSRLRLRGEGGPGQNGGPPGDLYVVLHVKDSDVFQRHEDDIVVTAEVSIAQAVLGADITIPTLEGEDTFSVPTGSQPETLHRLSGRGIARLHGYGRGDLIVRLLVKVPTKVSKEEEELYRKLAELDDSSVRPHHKGFFEKLRG
ncbi:MAG: molecular chaperone DnaJ [Nitrospinota bacterium]|nr:molecular chaperone DnaJ [Nitrospinota bacterium]